jgi:hypothetical protein
MQLGMFDVQRRKTMRVLSLEELIQVTGGAGNSRPLKMRSMKSHRASGSGRKSGSGSCKSSSGSGSGSGKMSGCARVV